MLAPRRSRTGSRHIPRAAALLVPLAAALIGAGCSGGDDPGDAVARLTSGSLVEVARSSGWSELAVGDEIAAGTRLRTGEKQARLAMRSGHVWLGPQAAAEFTEDHVELARGEALVESDGDLRMRWTEVEVAGEGVYRLSPGLAPRLGVYRGDITVRRPSEVRTVPPLREASLSARRLPAMAQPLTYRHDDPWDRILLRDAIAFDGEADRLLRGLAREYGNEPQAADFYATFAAAPDATVPVVARHARLRAADGRFGPPGEALFTLFVAQSAAREQAPEAVAEAVDEVAGLRSAGARWGLVAVEFDVTGEQLAAAVDAGRQRRMARLARAQPAGPPPAPSTGGRTSSGDAEPVSPPRSGGGGAPPQGQPRNDAPPPTSPSTPPRNTQDPEPTSPPAPQPDPTDPLDDEPSGGLLESVVDLLFGPS